MNPVLTAVLAYLKKNDFRRASFERLLSNVSEATTEVALYDIVRNNPTIFTSITLAGHRPGLKLHDSWNGVIPEPAPIPVPQPSVPMSEAELAVPADYPTPPPAEPVKVDNVAVLIQRGAEARDPKDAVAFTQAAFQAAQALATMAHIQTMTSAD